MTLINRLLPPFATLVCAAHFGMFFAWICTTMWGLDAADPRVAIAAMQAMNNEIPNTPFAFVFLGAPILLLLTCAALWCPIGVQVAGLFGIAGGLVLCGSVILTMTANVPMNERLATVAVPQDIEAARAIWAAYSPGWQFWNVMRTVASGAATLIALFGLQRLPRH